MKNIHLIGNAHLDPVWYWHWQEGFAEVMATFRSALDRMKEFEDYKFTAACSVYYMWIEKSDRAMFNEIRERVREGRWNIVGGWFLQPDCNIPCGEAFARHALVSQRYFKEKFGITAKCGYNVDSFGHNGSIPKILRNSGMDSYVYMRPMPGKTTISQSLFLWESMDGSSVLTYRIPLFYNIDLSRFDVFHQIAEMQEGYDMMAFYGVGNHGGGPTKALLYRMEKELGEEYIYSTPDEYFEAVKEEKLPTVRDDLQFHAKGCYSAYSKIKKWNRAAENAVLECEKYSVLSEKLMNTPYPVNEMKRAWENILFNQFHDILGGCCTKDAYRDVDFIHKEAMSIAIRNTTFALSQISWNIDTMGDSEPTLEKQKIPSAWYSAEDLGTPVVIFNSLAHPVKSVITIKDLVGSVKDSKGNELPIQEVRDTKVDGNRKLVSAFWVEVPALGYTVCRIYRKPAEKMENPFICTENSIENNLIKIVFNSTTGELKSIYDKKSNRELLENETSTILVDETHCDTWGSDAYDFKNVVGKSENGSVKLTECGPARATMRSHMQLFNTEIIRDYTLIKDSNTVWVKTKIDFREKHKMLKFSLPVNVEKPEAFCEIPFGFIGRSNDGAEHVCGAWTTVQDDGCGITLANDSKHSFDVDKNVMSLTILRGAIYADHRGERDEFCEFMEQGIHEFEYSISPFKSFADSEIKAQELNNNPTAMIETFHKGKLGTDFSGISVSEDNIIVTAVKKHEDSDAIVVRCYETEDRDTDVTVEIFGTKIQASFKHSEVKTFVVDSGAVYEADFMEWKL